MNHAESHSLSRFVWRTQMVPFVYGSWCWGPRRDEISLAFPSSWVHMIHIELGTGPLWMITDNATDISRVSNLKCQAPGDQILTLARYLQFYCGDEDHSSYEWSSIVKKPSHLGFAIVFLVGIRPNNAKLSTLVLVCWRSREMNIHSTTTHRWPCVMVFSGIEQPTWFK